jgi:4-hydroxy-2-oxoheptanedioate aldolase
MNHSKVLARIRSGQVARICALGHFLPFFPKLAAHFGYDGVWVDAEHRAFDPREAQALLAFHRVAEIDCIWRPPTTEEAALYRLLEDGATGLMIPHVSTAEEARALVAAVRFPPLGERGLDGAGLDADFMTHASLSFPEHANQETLLVVQIETPAAVENASAIAAVPGVDVLFIGPGDLSLRLGCAPAVDDPRMMRVHEKVAQAARMHGKAWGRPVADIAEAGSIQALGARFIVLGDDFGAIYSHLASLSADLDTAFGVSPIVANEPTLSQT